MERREKMEVLAPAGSMESMKAAINAGADAVYMGGRRFGARAYAENPEEDMLLSAIDYAHLHGRRLYLTVNTLLKERELEKDLYSFLLPYYKAGVDALIVQDVGVWKAIKEWFPDVPIHASTQMTITGPDGALEAKRMGASRIVTARELSTEEIADIHEKVPIEIETFVHGALCYCYSGQCLYSSLIGGRSGNRGRCAQPCRLPYDVWDHNSRKTHPDSRYVMNLKDICGLDSLPELYKAGVNSLKIEGRMKSPRYTAGVVSIYRKYVDMLKEGKSVYRVEERDKKFLLELFDRGGFSDGYFHKHNGRDMIALQEKPAFREVDAKLLARLDSEYIETEIKEKIKGKLIISENLPAKLALIKGDTEAEVSGEVPLPAKSRPLTEADLRKQIGKMGGTAFVLDALTVCMDDGLFLPVKALNELRRSAVDALERSLLEPYRRDCRLEDPKKSRDVLPEVEVFEKKIPKITVYVEEEEQFEASLEAAGVSRIYLSFNVIPWEQIPGYAKRCKMAGKEFYLALPQIYRKETEELFDTYEDFWHIKDVDGFLIRVIDELSFIEKLGKEYDYVADHSLYTFNQKARDILSDRGISMDTAPLELNCRELKERGLEKSEMIVYGRLPMMISAQCIRKTTERCSKRPGVMMLSDRKKRQFPVKNYCRFCYNIIYNSEPMWLADEIPVILKNGSAALRLQFTVEGAQEVREVIRVYIDTLAGESVCYQPSARTKGHFRRGVE